MPLWSKIAIPLIAIALGAFGYAYFAAASPCDDDPRSRDCYQYMLDTHLER